MYKICIFAGTTEGRQLTEFLCRQGSVSIMACVATEYGETLLPQASNLRISAERLTQEQMEILLSHEKFDLVVDATHPYAPVVTENIFDACNATGTEYIRLLRDGSESPEDAVFVSDIDGAVEYLNQVEGKVLLTTGSKELHRYKKMTGFNERVYARVLPMEDSLRLCREAGIQPSHILALQGPFSPEMNAAMLRSVGAQYMVTKESGNAGGFHEKIMAARQVGAKLVVIGRPAQLEGTGYGTVQQMLCRRFGFHWDPEVTIVGIGPGNRSAMTGEVLEAIAKADCVIGAKRMLLSAVEGDKPVYDAISPAKIADFIYKHREFRRFTVVMSGDVGFYSGTKKLLPLLNGCKTKVLPGLSSMVYLCAKLGKSYEDVIPVTAHGRDRSALPDIRRYSKIFLLVGGDDGMGILCRELCSEGLGRVKLSVGQRLSYSDEKILIGTAEELKDLKFDSLSVALIENPDASCIVTHGIPDDLFLRGEGTDGIVPMTKSEVRSVCLSKLRLTENAVCWDIGAGTGSVSIEMALQAHKGHVYAIERKEAAVNLLRRNSEKFGTEHLTVVPGLAPEICADLPAPTHVFIGGSAGNMKQIMEQILNKNPNARIVATAIAIESIAEITACMKELSFTETEICCLTVARDRMAGHYHLMCGQNPVYIFTMQAGGNA